MSLLEKLKIKAKDTVELQRRELIQLSLNIHDNPELGFQEEKASSWLANYLKDNGFHVEKGVASLPTAFRATYGQGKPTVAFLAEYDALPKIGHGCGHNVIAASAIGAGIAGKVAIDHLGGSIVVLGTPGEEVFGGKVIMVKAGVFDEIDVAMMVHPNTHNMVTTQALACVSLAVEFFGKPAHAAAQPHKGVNALEALILAFNSINSLRQHIRGEARIHGVITDGGEAPNVVPAHSAAKFLIRARDYAYLEELKGKVLNCFKGASLASGAELEYNWGGEGYAPLKNNMILAQLFSQNIESLGRHIEPFDSNFGFGSTDMGNVSQVVPSIHPMVAIGDKALESIFTKAMSAAASEAGHEGLVDAAKAMVMTMVDVLSQPEMLDKIKQEFQQQ